MPYIPAAVVVRLFVDDCVVYREIKSTADHDCLDSDLDNLLTWSNTWQMRFNASKCKILSVTNKRSSALFSYSLGEEHLEHVNSHRYLGVTCNSQLRWTDHINDITHKANRTLGIVRRMLKPCDIAVKTKASTGVRFRCLEPT